MNALLWTVADMTSTETTESMALVMCPTFSYTLKDSGMKITVSQRDGDVGLHVWEGAVVLSRYLEENAHILRDKDVLELGAGPGLAGLVAAYLGASTVTLTDGFQPVLETLQRSIALMTKPCPALVNIRLLNWCNLDSSWDGKTFDVIFGADIIYRDELVEPLINVIRRLSHDCTIVILSNTDRLSHRRFLKALKERNMHAEQLNIRCDSRIHLLRIYGQCSSPSDGEA